jgi:hypothetical protein
MAVKECVHLLPRGAHVEPMHPTQLLLRGTHVKRLRSPRGCHAARTSSAPRLSSAPHLSSDSPRRFAPMAHPHVSTLFERFVLRFVPILASRTNSHDLHQLPRLAPTPTTCTNSHDAPRLSLSPWAPRARHIYPWFAHTARPLACRRNSPSTGDHACMVASRRAGHGWALTLNDFVL